MADIPSHFSPVVDLGHPFLLAKFSQLTEHGLACTVAQITADIKADIQGLGSQVEAVETKLQTTIACTNQHMQRI